MMGGESRFLNHSCAPNCHIEKWNVLGEWRVGIFTSRAIPAGEELTYDYNFEAFGDSQPCVCGAPSCRGFIGKTAKAADTDVNSKAAGSKGKGKKGRKGKGRKRKDAEEPVEVVDPAMLARPMTQRQRDFVRRHRPLLLRNVDHVRGLRQQAQAALEGVALDAQRSQVIPATIASMAPTLPSSPFPSSYFPSHYHHPLIVTLPHMPHSALTLLSLASWPMDCASTRRIDLFGN